MVRGALMKEKEAFLFILLNCPWIQPGKWDKTEHSRFNGLLNRS